MSEWKTNGNPKMIAWFVQKLYGGRPKKSDFIRITVPEPLWLSKMQEDDSVTLYFVNSEKEVLGEIDLIRTADGRTLWIIELGDNQLGRLQAMLTELKEQLQANGWAIYDRSLRGKKSKGKQGPRNFSREAKVLARQDWDNLDRDVFAVNLEDFLEERFGIEGGKLKVPKSTFYCWPKE